MGERKYSYEKSKIMKSNIKISIVVPIYNVQDYVKKCIESIMSQSYKTIEIILVDDGSTDSSPQICDYYAKKDSRIRVIHKKNGGLVSARKAGTAVATGDYILAVDGDDWIEEDRIEDLVVKGIMSARADMIYMDEYKKDYGEYSQIQYCDIIERTYYGDEIEKQIFRLNCGMDEELFNSKIVFSMWQWAIRRELLQEKQQLVDDRIVMGEDLICIWICLLSANSVTAIKQKGYHYVQRESSLMYNAIDHGGNYVESINILYHQLRKYIEEQSIYLKETKQIFICAIIKCIILVQYELIIRQNSDYLYPFSKVKKGCRVIIYGAGRMGYALMKYLINTKEYQVALWVDQNTEKVTLPGYRINSAADIGRVDYDYIIIAVTRADVAKEIKKSLMLIGIPEGKIVWMDPDVITEDALPDEIKGCL